MRLFTIIMSLCALLLMMTISCVPTKTSTSGSDCIDQSKIDADAMCMMVYEPVCACDGKTYGNACEAEKAGLTAWESGECDTSKLKKETCIDESKINTDAACAEIYQPVCGCNGKTYGNECEATNAGLTAWTKGRCAKKITCIDESKIRPKMPCTRDYNPVCGCDGKTYSNSCEAKKSGVTDWLKGTCDKKDKAKNDCIDESKIDAKGGCIKIFRPVCGCDGETYDNECFAEKAGLKGWKEGKCSN